LKRFNFLNGAAVAALVIGATMTSSPLVTAPAEAQSATAVATVRVEQFRETLAPLGDTVQVQGLGEVWKPRDVAPDWQPYSVGRWIFNEKVGWYFQSDEPWAEITFHYGRWYDDPEHGWVWVAGTEWASAWVEWRRSKQYVGWRPLPPENALRRTAARSTTSRSTTTRSRRAGSTEVIEEAWVFVPTERIVADEISTVRVQRTRVVEIYEETRPIGRVERRGTIAVNFALLPEVLERETRVTVRTQNLPRAVAAPVPRAVQSIATETRSTTSTSSGTTSTTGTDTATGQSTDAPGARRPQASTVQTPNQDQPASSAETPQRGDRPSASDTTGTAPADAGSARSTTTTPPGAEGDQNRTRAQRRPQREGAGAPAPSGDVTKTQPPASRQGDDAATRQERRDQPQQSRDQRRQPRQGQERPDEAAESPEKPAARGQAPAERARRPSRRKLPARPAVPRPTRPGAVHQPARTQPTAAEPPPGALLPSWSVAARADRRASPAVVKSGRDRAAAERVRRAAATRRQARPQASLGAFRVPVRAAEPRARDNRRPVVRSCATPLPGRRIR
jgi:hypothetical protein